MLVLLTVLLPFAASVVAAFLPTNARNAAAWLAGGTALVCTALVAGLYPAVMHEGVVRIGAAWMPELGLTLYFRMDGYAWLFALLVSLMGTLVVLYARYYMSDADPVPRFFSFLMAFMGSMLGIVLSGNLIQLVVFWELTSLTSFMLIGYWYHLPEARRGARMALIVTVGGGLCLLLAVLLLGKVAGSYELDGVFAAAGKIRSDRWYPAIVVLLAAGALTKSAQFPFHFWLPRAMTAPTPVSAYLHSATMVKAGVFLLARLWPVLAGTQLWFWLFSLAGGLTLLVGAYLAIFERDMKSVLAYSTVSHLGLITLLIGMNSALALVAAVFHMLNHATFKASLFMAAGIVEHETGTRDMQRLHGLRHAMPITAIVATVAAGAMAGVPLLNGFISKEMFFAESIVVGTVNGLEFTLPAVATVWGVFSVAYSARLIHHVFFGAPPAGLPRPPHEPTRGMLLPSAVLVVACLLVGILPRRTLGPLLETAMASVLGSRMPVYELAVWHGITPPFVMSLVALAGGVALYTLLNWQGRALRPAPLLGRLDAGRMFDVANVAVVRGADRLADRLFSTHLQPQLLLVVVIALAAGGLALMSGGWSRGPVPVTPVDPLFAGLWIVGGSCAIGAAVRAKFHRLAALIMLGGAGLVTCLTFAWLSAPDLALTQIAVEIATTVLLLLGLRWLPPRLEIDDPRRRTLRARARRTRDAAVAVAVGAGLAALAFATLTRPPRLGLARYFLQNALPEAGGRNVVNVILVDFRGFDTLGEITVVGIVALIVYGLLRRFRPAADSIEISRASRTPPREQAASAGREDAAAEDAALALPDPREPLPQGDLRLPAVLVRLLLPMAALVSLYLLLRGHNAPGGGFVGGLVMATAFIAQYMVGGTIWVESRLRIHPQILLALGLLAAAGAGMAAWLVSRPFLTALAADFHVPLIGDVHLSTVLLFDCGVYLLVVGGTVLMLVALAHQSLRDPRTTTALADMIERLSPSEDEV
ncbi:MAG TPA: monovalent cation/H+ antiporter subunit A [Gammaproteobacteria bacterium]|nr:monovalent cation/H+ antiporter subunit A [Gammaproteobacteria bacterium]